MVASGTIPRKIGMMPSLRPTGWSIRWTVLNVTIWAALIGTAQQSAFAQGAPAAASTISAEQVSKANNPLSGLNALNIQDSYQPSLYSIPNATANTMFLRSTIVARRQILRATVPIATRPSGYEIFDLLLPPSSNSIGLHSSVQGTDPSASAPIVSITYGSGFGDFNIFDLIRISSDTATTQLAAGPQLVAPTATDKALGSGKWQAGLATAAVRPLSRGSLLEALFTWQHSFAGQRARADTNLFTFQPNATFSLGGGYYVRSSGIWSFDAVADRYLIPLGVGAGKVFKAGKRWPMPS
jgi:hypothetical protein